MKVWIQKWGKAGCPERYSVHLQMADIDPFLRAIRDEEADRSLGPDKSFRLDGEPYQADVSDPKLLTRLDESAYGVWDRSFRC